MIDLADRTALVTGGSRGIGRACAETLAAAGARVVVNYRLERPWAERVAQRICEAGGTAHAAEADIAQRDEADSLVDDALERYGSLDIVVNNAGIWSGAPIEEISDGEWQEMLGVNLTGTFNVIRAAVPAMKSAGRGRIINIASTAGQRGEALHAHYAATKGGVIALTRSLAAELGPHGILTTCVAPGWVETDMTREALAGDAGRAIAATIPIGRVGRPDEIASVVAFLASDLSSYINGAVLSVNGGSLLAG